MADSCDVRRELSRRRCPAMTASLQLGGLQHRLPADPERHSRVWPDGLAGDLAQPPPQRSSQATATRFVVDALMTTDESRRSRRTGLLATGKNPTDIYITHGHADHFFGLNSCPRGLPGARRAVALAEVLPSLQSSRRRPTWMQIWEGIFPGRALRRARRCRSALERAAD